eukprot:m.57777 g.57777  ORF g.57777 m.57777 type:complete len:561 (-) comp11132_c0_seq1:2150-3832(-)
MPGNRATKSSQLMHRLLAYFEKYHEKLQGKLPCTGADSEEWRELNKILVEENYSRKNAVDRYRDYRKQHGHIATEGGQNTLSSLKVTSGFDSLVDCMTHRIGDCNEFVQQCINNLEGSVLLTRTADRFIYQYMLDYLLLNAEENFFDYIKAYQKRLTHFAALARYKATNARGIQEQENNLQHWRCTLRQQQSLVWLGEKQADETNSKEKELMTKVTDLVFRSHEYLHAFKDAKVYIRETKTFGPGIFFHYLEKEIYQLVSKKLNPRGFVKVNPLELYDITLEKAHLIYYLAGYLVVRVRNEGKKPMHKKIKKFLIAWALHNNLGEYDVGEKAAQDLQLPTKRTSQRHADIKQEFQTRYKGRGVMKRTMWTTLEMYKVVTLVERTFEETLASKNTREYRANAVQEIEKALRDSQELYHLVNKSAPSTAREYSSTIPFGNENVTALMGLIVKFYSMLRGKDFIRRLNHMIALREGERFAIRNQLAVISTAARKKRKLNNDAGSVSEINEEVSASSAQSREELEEEMGLEVAEVEEDVSPESEKEIGDLLDEYIDSELQIGSK